MNSTRTRRGFSLIELLVVVAIVALLMALLMPALRHARASAYAAKELSAGRQLMIAYHAYAQDYGGRVMPALLKLEEMEGPGGSYYSSTPPVPGERRFRALDADGDVLAGETGRRYPWRIAPYMSDHDFRGIVTDRETFADYSKRADAPELDSAASRQFALSHNPTFGINGTYLSGEAVSEACINDVVCGVTVRSFWRVDQANMPDRLMVFASARGTHVDQGPSIMATGPGGAATAAYSLKMAPGNFGVMPPRYVTTRWYYDTESVEWEPGRVPDHFGNLDLRHNGKAACANIDGSALLLGLTPGSREGLRDMRRWSNDATSPDWTGVEGQ